MKRHLLSCVSFMMLACSLSVYGGGLDTWWSTTSYATSDRHSSPNTICERMAPFVGPPYASFSHTYDTTGPYYGGKPSVGCSHTYDHNGAEVTLGSGILIGEAPCPKGFSTASGGSCQAVCQQGQSWDPASASCITAVAQHNCATTTLNPIDLMLGKKYRHEPVLRIGSRFPIDLVYRYNSHAGLENTPYGQRPGQYAANTFVAAEAARLSLRDLVLSGIHPSSGPYTPEGKRAMDGEEYTAHPGFVNRYWRHNYESYVQAQLDSTGPFIKWHRSNGNAVKFRDGVNTAYPDLRLSVRDNSSGWDIDDSQAQVTYVYAQDGRLLAIKDIASGQQHTLVYEEDTFDIKRIEHSLGGNLSFTYQAFDIEPQDVSIYTKVEHNYPARVSASNGLNVDLTWSSAQTGRFQRYYVLESMSFPYLDVAAGGRFYTYGNSNYPAALTEIYHQKDADIASRKLYAEFRYDTEGRAIYSSLANGIEAVSVSYPDENTRVLTNAFNKAATYRFSNDDNVKRLVSVSGEPTATCLQTTAAYSYNAQGQTSELVVNGTTTTYQYNARGLETSRVEASGNDVALTTTTEWDEQHDLPTRISAAGQDQRFTYDESGLLTHYRVVAGADERFTTYSYNDQHQLSMINGPREDIDDISALHYDDEHNLHQVVNALNQSTYLANYDLHGNAGTITDANGVSIHLTYLPEGWLSRSTIVHPSGNEHKNLTTQYTYDKHGNVTRIILPDGQTTDYEYDDAQRLTAIENVLGERYQLTLDAQGNAVGESIVGASDSLVYQIQRVFDELSRVQSVTAPNGNRQLFNYDANNNLSTSTDGRNNDTGREYDALNRLTKAIAPLNRETGFGYDPLGRLTSVTDARGLNTVYTYNGFGEVTRLTSPDTGIKDYVYDSAGNLVSEADARGVVALYQYDALNRVTDIVYPNAPEENVSYSYDSTENGNYGIGRVTKIEDASGVSHFKYDYLGNLVRKTYSIRGVGFDMEYHYDNYARLDRMVYPSGRIVNYTYNPLGQIASITTQAPGASAVDSVVNNVQYLPYGPVKSWEFGNGVVQTFEHDTSYRVTQRSTNGTTFLDQRSFGYDANNNITALTDPADVARSQTFGYTAADEVASALGPYGDISFTYDGVGNRKTRQLTQGHNTNTETYQYATDSQQLTHVSGPSGTRNLSYDDNGNLIHDVSSSSTEWVYNDRNRPVSTTTNAVTYTYVYNVLGQRTFKGSADTARYFHYDESGQVIAVSNAAGVFEEEHLWLYSTPVAALIEESIGDSYPHLVVQSPQADTRYLLGDSVVLTASAMQEGIDLTSSVEWSSDIDGALGVGGNVQTSLTAGMHIISARVMNGGGLVSVSTRVVHVNVNARLALVEPVSLDNYVVSTDSHSFTASAIHYNGNDISAAIQWASDIDNAIGQGGTIQPNLSDGAHNITATLLDNGVTSRVEFQYFVAGDSDSDQDGLPDNWEVLHFGDLSQLAEGDFDADGASNLDEYLRNDYPNYRGTQLS